MADLRNLRWQADIDSFQNRLTLLKTVKTPATREKLTEKMREIQARWPQFIGAGEVPEA